MSALKNEAVPFAVAKSEAYRKSVCFVEGIEWNRPGISLPDDETTVLLRLDEEAFFDRVSLGQRYADEWFTLNDLPIEDKHVLAWAHMPAGPDVRS